MDKKIGLVVMFKLDAGGGAPRLIVNLIEALNILGYKVFLLNPFKLNYHKIEEMYDPIAIERVYGVSKIKRLFCQSSILGRKLIKKEFQEMAKDVDKIIDVDGGIVHDYLPKDFDKSKYIIWRFAAMESESMKNFKNKRGTNRIIKDFIKKFLRLEQSRTLNPLSKEYKIYPIDEWTKKKLIEKWGLSPEEPLIHPIYTEKFLYKEEKKKDQIAVMVRLAPNKMIDDSIQIFFRGTKKHQNYKLVILGGTTSDSGSYLAYLNKLIEELGIQERVSIIKNPSTKQCREFLVESRVLIDSQRDIGLSMGPVEAMAAGCTILAPKNTGTYLETLQEGKFGFGFDTKEEGGEKLETILDKLKNENISNKKIIKRSGFLSKKNFIKRLKEVLK